MALGSSTRRYLSSPRLNRAQPTWLTSLPPPDYRGQPPIDWRLPRASPNDRPRRQRSIRPWPRLGELSSARGEDRLIAAAGPILSGLRSATGESAQLYRRQGEHRVCIASAEPTSGLRDTVPIGTVLPMKAGSAAQVLLAWEDPATLQQELRGARFSAAALAKVRQLHWAQSVGQREPGVASVSAPVRSGGQVIAAISISGPIERLTRSPARSTARP